MTIYRSYVTCEATEVLDEYQYRKLLAFEDSMDKFPPDKSSRWIGYTQRCLIEKKYYKCSGGTRYFKIPFL